MITVKLAIGPQNNTDCYEVKSVLFEPSNPYDENSNQFIDGLSFNTIDELKAHIVEKCRELYKIDNINIEIM